MVQPRVVPAPEGGPEGRGSEGCSVQIQVQVSSLVFLFRLVSAGQIGMWRILSI